MNKDKLKKILLVSIITTLMGQVYVNPFNSHFRLSIGIAILTFLLMKFHEISIFITTLFTAVMVFIFRFSLDIFQINYLGDVESAIIAVKHLPSAIFYIVFGFILSQLDIRNYREKPIYFVFLVGISDIVSNVAEAAVRHEFTRTPIEMILTSLFVAGFGRALISLVLYSSLKFYNMLILREVHQRRYVDLLMFTANMKAEIFFLKKTMQDIEQAMERCYSIYTELKSKKENTDLLYIEHLKDRVLNLSKDIHEIKKDNQRVISGIERLIPEIEKDNIMKLSTIFQILQDNTERLIQFIGKEIHFFADYSKNVLIKDYFPLITILNNLISNAIDSIENDGYIRISQGIKDKSFMLYIRDNGSGIKKEDIDVIFEPGFSTKFNKKTGKMSTGIGLTHVKHIVENHYKGSIEVKSQVKYGTVFTVCIPIENILYEEGE